MKKLINEIIALSDLENIFSAEEMQDALEKIHEKAKLLLDELTYTD